MAKSLHKLPIILVLLLFLLTKIIAAFSLHGIRWDSAVYIGMGKYIFSLGKAGLWEPARPLIWPLFLGTLWKIGLNPVIFSKVLELAFSLGCIYLAYLIGKEIFNEKIALLSSFFLAFSPVFMSYSSIALTGIPSTFFALLSIYSLVKKRYFLTGLFLGLSFMTRFLQLFILIPLFIYIIMQKKKRLRNILSLSYGFSIITLPHILLNLFLYKNPIYPFILQMFMSKYTGWVFNQPFSFYFINLLKENFLVLFAVVGIILIPKDKDHKKTLVLGVFLLFFIFFNSIAHKETRFTLVFLPYLYLITSYGIFKSIEIIKKKKTIVYLAAIILGLTWLCLEIPQIKPPPYKEYPQFTGYIGRSDVNDGIWVSNPIFIVNSDKKPDELIYYPLYNSKKIEALNKNLPKAKHILIDTCDILPCPPTDRECPKKTEEFLNSINENFKTIYYGKEGECEQFIFKKG